MTRAAENSWRRRRLIILSSGALQGARPSRVVVCVVYRDRLFLSTHTTREAEGLTADD
jgi:hypothetical protein